MDYFDLDASFSEMTPAEQMTYEAIQDIYRDERSGWLQNTYREHDIKTTSYDIAIVKVTEAITKVEEKTKKQEALIETLQKKDADLTEARRTMVELLDLIDLYNKRLEDYIVNATLEKLRLNKLHTISYRYKISRDKDMLVLGTKSLMDYIVANRTTFEKVP
jgi:translation initiation factor 2B subunit (eIF-2B alpha/beta/delta family)